MRKMKNVVIAAALLALLILGIGVEARTANSYSVKNKSTLTVENEKPGKTKKYYFNFKLSKRGYAQMTVHQEYVDGEVKGLKTADLPDSYIRVQKKIKGKWKNTTKNKKLDREIFSYEGTDHEEKNLGPNCMEGDGGLEVHLDRGTYRYVLTTGYPKSQLTCSLHSYKKAPVSKKTAQKLNKKGEAKGIFTVTEKKTQWYRFRVTKKQKMQVGMFNWGNEDRDLEYRLTLMDSHGKTVWKKNKVTWQEDKKITLKKGTYYFKIQRTKQKGDGIRFLIYAEPWKKS